MANHIKRCEIGDNWKDCPACVEAFNTSCMPKQTMPLPSRIALEHRGDAQRHMQAGDEPWGERE